ncbi:siderophore ABC transporter substrate-binding protein [Vagococcus sp. PNs007]|uniref:Siderophore ABC transporter substrate-binding protein n=2 Tax=Vagococcus proximus TaxID=2991417 RepID=A0ABT5X3R1_9ENTE|nr:siderophore ABC transporter substrate-binding protein [Vagococcus proximus]MDF0480615.1 siderophore ABC transporter substrate-binding protein [Vagococcus proximus]
MMRKTKFKAFGIVLAGMLVMAGCSKPADNKEENEAKGDKVSQVITVEDASGKVEVPTNPKKVVVFDMGSLDTIRELGKEKSVIGVPQKNLPKYLESFKEVESVGGLKEPDLEKINQLKPDLIVISGRQEDYKKDLEAIAPTVYLSVDSSKTWESTVSNIKTLAKIFDEEKVAKEKVATIENKIKAVKKDAQASGLKTLTTLVNEGQLSAYGEGSRFGIIHDTFGFPVADDKIEASTHGQSVSYEYVLEKNPDIIFVVDRTKAIGGDTSQNNVAKNELVAQTKAGQTNKVVSLTPDVWYLSGGGIKCTELMLEDVEKALK